MDDEKDRKEKSLSAMRVPTTKVKKDEERDRKKTLAARRVLTTKAKKDEERDRKKTLSTTPLENEIDTR